MARYKVGFTAGTYDMFHVGHLNLLKQAKEYCDYLIVGVNATELVESYKHKSPLIPQDDRLSIVSAIKFVDEAHIMHSLDKVEAYKQFHFDVVFIGNDYKGSARYQETEKNLNALNVDLIFLDYTKRVSSTMLAQRLIDTEINREYYHLDKSEDTHA